MDSRVDIGADEVGPKQADFTRNGKIDFEDLAVFTQSWLSQTGQPNWYILCDLYRDGKIEFKDFSVLTEDWFWEADWYGN